MGTLQVLDSHVHVWELSRRPQLWIDPRTMPVLHRDHALRDLQAELATNGIDGAVLVQVLNDAGETDDYLWAGTASAVRGVVGWVDLLAPDVADQVDALLAHQSGTLLVGIRHQALAEPDPAAWLSEVADGAGFSVLADRGLAFDLMFRPGHLCVVRDVVRRHEEASFVLDHAGKAPVLSGWSSEESQAWAHSISELALLDNLVCKLSGLATMADLEHWAVDDLRPYVEHLLTHFGPERLMFGSDWPVSLRAAGYSRTLEAARQLMEGLSLAEQQHVFAGTAARTYRLARVPVS